MTHMKIGFWGFGKYCQAFAERIVNTSMSKEVDIRYYDPFISRKTFKNSNNPEDLFRSCDVLVIGLPFGVSETIANLLHFRDFLESEQVAQKVTIRLIVSFDSFPMNEIFEGIDIPRVSIMFNLEIRGGKSPIAFRVEDNKSDTVQKFKKLIECCCEAPFAPIIVREPQMEMSVFRLLIGTALLVPRLVDGNKKLIQQIIEDFLQAIRNRGLLKKSVSSKELESIIQSISESTIFSKSGVRDVVEAIGHRGGPTWGVYNNYNNSTSATILDSLLKALWEHLATTLAFTVEAHARMIVWQSHRLPRPKRTRVVRSRLHHMCEMLMKEWKPLLRWCNIYERFQPQSIVFGDPSFSGNKVISFYDKSPKDYQKLLKSMNSFLKDAGQVESVWIFRFSKHGNSDFSGQYHKELSGAYLIDLPRCDYDDVVYDPNFSISSQLERWNPSQKLKDSFLNLTWWIERPQSFESSGVPEKFLRYFAWLHLAYPASEWESVAFVPGSYRGVVGGAIALGGSICLASPVSTSFSNLAQLVFGTLSEWTIDDFARKSARAAVFARNFSHVTGSHVVSNPAFREALVGASQGQFRNELERSYLDFENTLEDYLRNGFETDPKTYWEKARDMLGRGRHQMRTGGVLTEGTRRFHEYLQGRFDFIARAIDETQDQPEPVFFVADLLEGFLAQTAFLDTFVGDLGLRLPDIYFEVHLPSENDQEASFITKWEQSQDGAWEHTWVPANEQTKKSGTQIGDHAVLVALPGGMIAVHAFYSLLENIIRNSAKYGKNKNGKQTTGEYRIVLELKADEMNDAGGKGPHGTYSLKIGDNYSPAEIQVPKAATINVWESLNKQLHAGFLARDGSPRREGLGMLEMNACAEALGSMVELNINTKPKPLWVLSPDESFGEEGEKWITYRLNLHRPLLVGIVCAERSSGSPDNTNRNYTKVFTSLEDAKGMGAHILVIDGDNEDLGKTVLKKLKVEENQEESEHPLFPYRILLLSTEGETGPVQVAGIPLRRVHTRQDADLHGRVFGKLASDERADKSVGLSPEEQLIMDVYDAWLRAWKKDLKKGDDAWHLWIGLEREPQQVKEMWKKCLSGDNEKCPSGFESDLIKIAVRGKKAGAADDEIFWSNQALFDAGNLKAEGEYWKTELKGDFPDKRALVFDNHGNCFPAAREAETASDFTRSTRFYQKLSGSGTPDLFRTLTHPPSSPFAFSFYIHSVVEACLTNVMIVDERLAADLLFERDTDRRNRLDFAAALAEHQKAGVFPVFRFKDKNGSPAHYHDNHGEAFDMLVETDSVEAEGISLVKKKDEPENEPEGAWLSVLRMEYAKPDKTKFKTMDVKNGDSASGSLSCDVLVIHEGALDLLVDRMGVDWSKKLSHVLWKIAPAVVRTSGRGRHTKHLYDRIPFVEFNEVSSAVLTARNKVSLVRGLLGTTGAEENLEDKS